MTFRERMKPYIGRIVLTLLGLCVGILFLTIGFWRTLVLLIPVAIGYVVGCFKDGKLDLSWLFKKKWR